jgi:hypothetical protein
MNKHLQIDIETGANSPNSHVLTIGLLLFDPLGDGSLDEGWHLGVPANMNKGRELNYDTLAWWMKQSDKARNNSWVNPHSYREAGSEHTDVPVGNLQHILRTAVTQAEHIWANDPDFDCVIMRSFFETNGWDFRWPFGKHRSMRTIKALFDIPAVENTLAHDALADCRYQAAQVRHVYQGNAPWRA